MMSDKRLYLKQTQSDIAANRRVGWAIMKIAGGDIHEYEDSTRTAYYLQRVMDKDLSL